MNIIELLDSAIRMLDCGTGSGGFKEGNTCAKGGGGKEGIAGGTLKDIEKGQYQKQEVSKKGHGPLWENMKYARDEKQKNAIIQGDKFWQDNLPITEKLVEQMDNIVNNLTPEKRSAVAEQVKKATERLGTALYYGYELITTTRDNPSEHKSKWQNAVDNFKSIMDSLNK